MSDKVEGTVILDGLIQGKVPALPGAEQRLRDWEEFVRSVKLKFNLEISGGTFGFLADQTPIATADLGNEPAETITSALGQLLKIFPPNERTSVFSTLRCVEYRSGEEVQTLFIIAPDGSVLSRGRTVSANTKAPPAKLLPHEKAIQYTIGAVLLVLVLMISSLFIDYRSMFSGLKSQLRPLDAPHFPVDASAYEAFFTIENISTSRDGQGLSLTLHRLPAFLDPARQPTSRATTQTSTTHPATTQFATTSPDPDPMHLAAVAVATGYVRCEFFDERGQFMGFIYLRIKALRDAETIDLEIPFATDRRPSALSLTY